MNIWQLRPPQVWESYIMKCENLFRPWDHRTLPKVCSEFWGYLGLLPLQLLFSAQQSGQIIKKPIHISMYIYNYSAINQISSCHHNQTFWKTIKSHPGLKVLPRHLKQYTYEHISSYILYAHTCWYSRSNFKNSSSQLSTMVAKLFRFFTGLPLKARIYTIQWEWSKTMDHVRTMQK